MTRSGGFPSIRSASSTSLRGSVVRTVAPPPVESTSCARALATSMRAPFVSVRRRRWARQLVSHDAKTPPHLPTGSRRTQRARRRGGPPTRAKIARMAPPLRIGVMQLTMEPLDEMLATARIMDEAGLDTIWLAEAYPWWRKHGMEARSSTVVSALMARETSRLTIGWGIISPFTRHPVQVAMDARVVQEAAGPGRFILGYGTSKIFLNNAKM